MSKWRRLNAPSFRPMPPDRRAALNAGKARARDLLDRGQIDEALPHLQRLVIDYPDDGDLQMMFAKGKAAGIETRGISDHGFIDSIYFRDPNGYVIELTAKREGHDEIVAAATETARQKLDEWQRTKPPAVAT